MKKPIPFKKRSTSIILLMLVVFSMLASVLSRFIKDDSTRNIVNEARWMVYGLLVGFFISRDNEGKNENDND